MILGILILCLIALSLYPFWRHEGFRNQAKRVRVEFRGKRWNDLQITSFQSNLKDAPLQLKRIQENIIETFGDYKRVMGKLEKMAYDKDQSIRDLPKSLTQDEKDEILRKAGILVDPLTDFYKPLIDAQDSGMEPIVTRGWKNHKFKMDLPTVVIPSLKGLDTPERYRWATMKDATPKYDIEETFYKDIETSLPAFYSAVQEVARNIRILEQNSGSQFWSVRPRVDKIMNDADKARKSTEGFECPDILRVIKVSDYEKWGEMSEKIKMSIKEIERIYQRIVSDIESSERSLDYLENEGKQGSAQASSVVN